MSSAAAANPDEPRAQEPKQDESRLNGRAQGGGVHRKAGDQDQRREQSARADERERRGCAGPSAKHGFTRRTNPSPIFP